MMEEDGTLDTGHVIFSLLVNSDNRLSALAHLPGRDRPAAPGDDHLYVVYESSFEEPAWSARADRVNECIHEAVDALVSTGIRLDALSGEHVTVRAHSTFPHG